MRQQNKNELILTSHDQKFDNIIKLTVNEDNKLIITAY